MHYVDEYRVFEQVIQLAAHPQRRARLLPYTAARPPCIMEVCGGHTHAILKFGLDQLLPENTEFIHRPGCPAYVLPMGRIDICIEIASRPGVIFYAFGDTMCVPGKNDSLLQAKSRGTDICIVCSPVGALRLAQQDPQREVIFFGLDLETTMPATALTLRQVREHDVDNFYSFCQHIALLSTLHGLPDQPDDSIDAFLTPGHASMVIGTETYDFIASGYHRPLAVAGFEPFGLLQGAVMLIEQTVAQCDDVENQYRRVVLGADNPPAQSTMADVFRLDGGSEWRGLGVTSDSGVQPTPAYQRFDAEAYFRPASQRTCDDPRTHCDGVLTGRCKPRQCPPFTHTCNP